MASAPMSLRRQVRERHGTITQSAQRRVDRPELASELLRCGDLVGPYPDPPVVEKLGAANHRARARRARRLGRGRHVRPQLAIAPGRCSGAALPRTRPGPADRRASRRVPFDRVARVTAPVPRDERAPAAAQPGTRGAPKASRIWFKGASQTWSAGAWGRRSKSWTRSPSGGRSNVPSRARLYHPQIRRGLEGKAAAARRVSARAPGIGRPRARLPTIVKEVLPVRVWCRGHHFLPFTPRLFWQRPRRPARPSRRRRPASSLRGRPGPWRASAAAGSGAPVHGVGAFHSKTPERLRGQWQQADRGAHALLHPTPVAGRPL